MEKGQHTIKLTIKEATIKVLSESGRAMAADEIYAKIIEQGLYEFGAINPTSVISVTIESSCDNSNYSRKYSSIYFHSDRNEDGTKVYSLLDWDQPASQAQIDMNNSNTNQKLDKPTIWDSTTELNYKSWLEAKSLTPGTVTKYLKAVNKALDKYDHIAKKAVDASDTQKGAIQRFIDLLNEDKDFTLENIASKGYPSAALNSLNKMLSNPNQKQLLSDGSDNEAICTKGTSFMEKGEHTIKLNIKEAAIKVLSESGRAMAADEIYAKIIEQGLYDFGAKNPTNVIRTTIESYCDNANYSRKNSSLYFHLDRNKDGKKVFSLLSWDQPSSSENEAICLSGSIDRKPEDESVESSQFSKIIDLENGKAGIDSILKDNFHNLYGYSNKNILWNAAKDSLFMFLNDNAINDAEALWRLACELFEGEYFISGTGIWESEPDFDPNDIGIIVNFMRHHGGIVDRSQIYDYFSQIELSLPRSIVQSGQLMFYQPRQFILTERFNATSDICIQAAEYLDKLFENENTLFIAIRDISEKWFSSLPPIQGNISWTALLLQEALRLFPSIGYQTIFLRVSTQPSDTLGAVIVPINSNISSFADAVHCLCFEKGLFGKNILVEELWAALIKAHMIEGEEPIDNLHTVLKDARFVFKDNNRMVKILER